jgi:multidrug efflux pump subunit AcrA (membrane-fusion protein)
MMKKKFMLAAGLAALILTMVVGYRIKAEGEWDSSVSPNSPSMKTATAETMPIEREITVSGIVVARQTAVISAQISGYLTDLRVNPGDHVKAGEVLLRIRTKELADKESQAKAALDEARATHYEVAQAAEQKALAALNESKEQLSYGKVRSPFDGIVSDKSVNVGDLVTQGQPLLTIYVPSTLELVAPVGEEYARYTHAATRVYVDVPSLGLKQATHIREVVPQTSEQARTITVKAPLSDAPGLTPGLYGTLSINTTTSEVTVVPSRAIRKVGQLESVRVLKNGRVETLYITTGRKLKGGKTEILSGLKPGELVVTD